ncbi:MAG: Rpp14/Pop5 family protein [Methanocellales archaeon]|nr:Rpp14/Pop5 family protein [Methanocellales archaeon]
MKNIPSSMRERKRYIAFEVLSAEKIDRSELINELWSSASSLLGEVGASSCNLWVLDFDGRRGILRCAHDKTAMVRAALATINRVHGTRAGIRVLGTSGTVKSVTEKFMRQVDYSKDTIN